MLVTEIREKILTLLKSKGYDGKILTSDSELCKLIGEEDYEKIHNVLNSLKTGELISWYRTGDGSTNNVTLIR